MGNYLLSQSDGYEHGHEHDQRTVGGYSCSRITLLDFIKDELTFIQHDFIVFNIYRFYRVSHRTIYSTYLVSVVRPHGTFYRLTYGLGIMWFMACLVVNERENPVKKIGS